MTSSAAASLVISTLSDRDLTSLIDGCLEAKQFSYSPYSKFRVGAALLEEGTNNIVIGKKKMKKERRR